MGRGDIPSEMWADIIAFHRKFQIPQQQVISAPDEELSSFRMRFLQEEVDEFVEAVDNNDMVKAFDALIDLVYVAMGTAYIYNFPWDKGWAVVHSANMRKERAQKPDDSMRGTIYDIVKPKGWMKPDRALIAQMLLHEHEILLDKNPEEVEEMKGKGLYGELISNRS